MPGRKQGESFILKHRLTGAAVLIGFAVIVLPMLLGAPDEEQIAPESGSTRGEPDTRVFHSNITPIGGATPNAQPPADEDRKQTVAELLERSESGSETDDDAGSQPQSTGGDSSDGATEPEPAESGESGDPGSQVAARHPDPDEADPDEADPGDPDDAAPAATDTTKKIERGWIVQVGTFRKADNVEKLVAKLESNGFGSSTTEVELSGGSATRVWVGPFATRVEAARIKTRVKQSTGSEGLIVAYP